MSTSPLSRTLRLGDASAFLELVHATYAPAMAFARTRCADAEAAEALLLDAYVAAYIRRREAPPDGARAWMLHAVMSECVQRTPAATDAAARRRPRGARWRSRATAAIGRTTTLLAGDDCRTRGRAARLGVRMLVPVLALLLGACREPLTDPRAAAAQPRSSGERAGDTLRVELGRAVRTEEGVVITFVQLVADSRCPRGATCVWEGDAAVRTRVQVRGTTADSVLHTSLSAGRPAIAVGGYEVRLTGVEPAPVLGERPPERVIALYVLAPAGASTARDTVP